MAKDLKNKPKPTSKHPLVSVVMPVFNGEKYLREAIDSILNQTFADFEFIIINDGSTDDTLKIIKGYKDPRIVLISRKNKGLVASLNEGIEKARGKYIARMDADDISLPERFEKQVEYLEGHPDCILLGTQIRIITDVRGPDESFITKPISDFSSRLFLGYGSIFAHPSIMANSKIMKKYPYRQSSWPAEDYYMWTSLAHKKQYTIHNLSSVLLDYRRNEDGISIQNQSTQNDSATKIARNYRSKYSYKLHVLSPITMIRLRLEEAHYTKLLPNYHLLDMYYSLCALCVLDMISQKKYLSVLLMLILYILVSLPSLRLAIGLLRHQRSIYV
jgi:glycosyltransferase involved in cell wall biosynthesis